MVVFKNQLEVTRTFPSYPEAQLNYLMSGTKNHNTIQLASSGSHRSFHKSLLRNASPFLADIISSMPNCEECVIILPGSPPDTLGNLVTLLYTGQVSGLSKSKVRHVSNFANILGLKISQDVEDIESDDSDEEDINADFESDDINKEQLKVKTTIVNKKRSLTLSFPKSRTNRVGFVDIKENLDGFHGRIQK